jgi:hypothetical protein
MSAFYDLASVVLVPSGYKSGKIYAQKPLTTDGQLTFTRASTATRVNASGLIETVASGVPRLDYTNSSCPKILLEPQRSNIALQSNALATGPWQNFGGTQTNNSGISPDGTNNATILESDASSSAGVYQTISATSGQTITVSAYVKLGTATNFCLVINNAAAWDTVGGQVFTTADGLSTTAWKRISFSFTSPASNQFNIHIGLHSQSGLAAQSLGSYYVYGVQAEIGSYMTSLIPTTTAAVTRVKDNCVKTGVSSLIGQTEGTVFVEFKMNGQSLNEDIYSNNKNLTGSISIQLGANGQLQGYICFNSGFISLLSSTGVIQIGQTYKIALAYKTGNSALYINGTQVATNTTAFAFTTTLSEIDIANDSVFFAHLNNKEVSQVLQFKTRLTNAQLAELTTL